MIRIIKGDITLECDTQADVKLALGVFADVDVPTLPSVHIPVEVNAPAWRVGGPRPEKSIGTPVLGESVTADLLETVEVEKPLMSGLPGGHIEVDKPKLVAVPDDAPSGRMHVDMGFDVPQQYIPVSVKQLEVLEAVLLFPEGVPSSGVAQLLGFSHKAVSGRMQMLKLAGLAELVPHSHRWRATTLARRAKLVRS